jgi:hypothetical protein
MALMKHQAVWIYPALDVAANVMYVAGVMVAQPLYAMTYAPLVGQRLLD